MPCRRILTVALIAVIVDSSEASAQQLASADVGLDVPVHLSRIAPDVTKVQVTCSITSVAITSGNGSHKSEMFQRQELSVTSGDLRTHAQLLFSFTNLDNPTGKTANVECRLDGWDQRLGAWDAFTDSHPNPSFRTNVTLGRITTSFVW